jgi:AraC-like DNA-binding protein
MPTKTKAKTINKQRALLVTTDASITSFYHNSLDGHITKSHATSYQEVQEQCRHHSPDIIFIDQALPDGSAENLIDQFYRRTPKTIIVLIVDHLHDIFVFKIWDKVNELLQKPLDETSFVKIMHIYGQFNDPSLSIHRFATLQITRMFADPNFSEKVIARVLGITPAYFSKRYKAKTGMTFLEVLQRTRINAACKLLRNTDLLIKQVAAQVGFRRVDSFIRNFQKSRKMSPGEFRRKIRMATHNQKYPSPTSPN